MMTVSFTASLPDFTAARITRKTPLADWMQPPAHNDALPMFPYRLLTTNPTAKASAVKSGKQARRRRASCVECAR